MEVFERNAVGRKFYSQYGFTLVEEKVHEQTGEPLLRLEFIANKALESSVLSRTLSADVSILTSLK